ncbi:short-subunit dehydrogenase [Pedobacter sp. UYP30]|uniref:SDR family NAD(P)-dependent oxidoreductase n=1 Tax=Pedobacter sp. UYP30 TaxID=1756400 RepID=UPI003394899A
MIALITGSTKGIGRAIAEKLAQHNYDLVLIARNAADLEKTAQELSVYGNKVFHFQLDGSKPDQIERFFNLAAPEFGTINVLVNNMGVFLPGSILEEPNENFLHQQEINVNAAYYFSKFFGKQMAAVKNGHIFNICSVASKNIAMDAGSYSVTKAAMLSLNNILRAELAPSRVKVTAFLPGPTLTASWKDTELPKEKFVLPGDIAELVYVILNLSAGANVDEVLITPLDFT